MICAEDSVDVFQRLLPDVERDCVLRDVAQALNTFYREHQVEGVDDDSLIVVAGKFGEGRKRQFDIGFYRSFGAFGNLGQFGVLLRFRINLRCLFLGTAIDVCDSKIDAVDFFARIPRARWFRRYAEILPVCCRIQWQGEEEMAESFCDIMPKLAEALGPDL